MKGSTLKIGRLFGSPSLLLVSGFERLPTGGREQVRWQTSVNTAPEGIVLGLRDKMEDMRRDYRVFFLVVTPAGEEATIARKVPAGSDEWVEVVSPRDFQAPAGKLVPGVCVCTHV
ncbi:MAG: hypothetical protein ACUVXF_10770 [Desulfobaccales bacterium]